jgi:hypothetical protein
MVGILKKKEKSLEILLNSKLSNLILHQNLELKLEMIVDFSVLLINNFSKLVVTKNR